MLVASLATKVTPCLQHYLSVWIFIYFLTLGLFRVVCCSGLRICNQLQERRKIDPNIKIINEEIPLIYLEWLHNTIDSSTGISHFETNYFLFILIGNKYLGCCEHFLRSFFIIDRPIL